MKIFYIPLLSVVLLSSCYYDNEEDLYQNWPDCDTTGITYQDDISAILNESCALSGCHNSDDIPGVGLDLNTYEDASTIAQDGRMWKRIYDEDPSVMPPGGRLDDCTLDKIKVWIDQGAPDN